MEVMDGPYIAAVVWGHDFVENDEKFLEMHACAAPEYEGRWLTRGVISQLFKINTFVNADQMMAEVTTEISERIWKRFGFHRLGNYMFRKMEKFDGWCEEAGFDVHGRLARPVARRAGYSKG
jgi:hypothetical protein